MMATTKMCTGCNAEKEHSAFSPQKGGKHGLASKCKECKARATRNRYAASSEALAAKAREKRAAHPNKNREAVKKYREANVEKRRKYANQYAKNNAGKHANWCSAQYVKNREKRLMYAAQWQKDNPGLVIAIQARRRTIKLKATPPWVDHNTITAIYIEAAKLTLETGIPHDVDHIVPLQGRTVCGLHVPWNLRAIPASENRSKSNKLLE